MQISVNFGSIMLRQISQTFVRTHRTVTRSCAVYGESYKSSYSLDKLFQNSNVDITAAVDSSHHETKPDEQFDGHIPVNKLTVMYSCSSGPGGQNVNKGRYLEMAVLMLLAQMDINQRRAMRRERVFRDRMHPLDTYNDIELYQRYRFDRCTILDLANVVRENLEPDAKRTHAFGVQTKADVRFHVESADWLPLHIRQNILEKKSGKLNNRGELILTSERTRSQITNFSDCLRKIQDIIEDVQRKPKEPSEKDKAVLRMRVERANRERLRNKKMHSATKNDRRVMFE